jgi:hypothetical protein
MARVPSPERGTPRNKDLDAVFEGAVSARVFVRRPLRAEELGLSSDELVRGAKPKLSTDELARRIAGAETTLASVAAPADLAALRQHLTIGKSGFRCMCMGGPVLEVSGREGVRARITLHHGVSIRWDGPWESDAELVDGPGLVGWLAERGVDGPRREVEASARRAQEARSSLDRWRRATPACLAPLWSQPGKPDAFANPAGSGERDATERALSALERAYEDPAERILAVFAWLGEAEGPWSGFPAHESFAEQVLSCFPVDAIVDAAATPGATPAQLRGAARAIYRRRLDSPLAPDLRDRLREHVDSGNLDGFDARFADSPTGRAKELREEGKRAAKREAVAGELLKELAPLGDDAKASGGGVYVGKGRRRAHLFVEREAGYRLIYFLDGKNAGDLRTTLVSKALREAKRWLRGEDAERSPRAS